MKTGSNLSLSSLMSADDKPEVEAAEVGAEAVLPSEELLREKWTELPGRFASQPRLASALSKSVITVSDEPGRKLVEFSVTNEAQKKWIEEKVLRDLEREFCALISNRAVRLAPSVIPEEQKEDVKYMPAEKAEDLIGRNEEVRNLVVDLSLDVK